MLPAKQNNWLPGIFNDFFGNEWIERAHSSSPAVNIRENENAYTVEVAAPGLTKDDFKIDLHDDNHLTVSMQKSDNNEEKDDQGRYLRREFSYSSFRQSMILPDDVEHDKIEAKVKDGVLKIRIPKLKEEDKPKKAKQIDIE